MRSNFRSSRPRHVASGFTSVLLATVGALAAGRAARAETLADAIALAYQSNPTLQSQRAQVRVLDEGYVQAIAGFRPQLGVQVTAGYTAQQQSGFTGGSSKIESYSNTSQALLAFSQPLITGGRVSTAVKAASLDVLAGREQLRAVEITVLQSVVQAYADVLRDQETLKVREVELEVLQSQLDDAQSRRRAGEITETDVLQSLTQLQIARSQLSTAQGQLQLSRAGYAAAVGQNPGQLAPLPDPPGLPADVDTAFDEAQANNPTLNQAQRTEEASRWRIAAARAENRPQVALQGSYGYSGTVAPFATNAFDHAFTAQAVLTQPLFTGGVNTSNIRKATALNDNDRIQIEAARRVVIEQVSQAWNQVLSLKQSLVSDEQEVITSRQYFADTEKEYRVGQRSTLDVLVAEQTLRAAEVSAIQVRHDVYVGQTALLGAMGRLTQAALVAGAARYDPSINFRKVANAQSVPWQGVVAAIDAASSPHLQASRPLSAPPLADPPSPMRLSTGEISIDAAPAVVTPTRPIPATTSPRTPALYGHDAFDPHGIKAPASPAQVAVAPLPTPTPAPAPSPSPPPIRPVARAPVAPVPKPVAAATMAAAPSRAPAPVAVAPVPPLGRTPSPVTVAAAPPQIARTTTSNLVAYTVAKGDTLYGLGRRFDLAPAEVAGANGLSLKETLLSGARLRLPVGARDGGEQLHASGAVERASSAPT